MTDEGLDRCFVSRAAFKASPRNASSRPSRFNGASARETRKTRARLLRATESRSIVTIA